MFSCLCVSLWTTSGQQRRSAPNVTPPQSWETSITATCDEKDGCTSNKSSQRRARWAHQASLGDEEGGKAFAGMPDITCPLCSTEGASVEAGFFGSSLQFAFPLQGQEGGSAPRCNHWRLRRGAANQYPGLPGGYCIQRD